MKRWQIIAAYACIGPILGGLTVAVGSFLIDPPSDRFLFNFEFVVVVLLFSFPYGMLSALASGLAHALLFPKVKPAVLVTLVCLVGLSFHIVTLFLIGNTARVYESPSSLLAFALPPVASAAILSMLLVRCARPRT